MLYRGFPLHPDDDEDPYVFALDFSEFGMGTGRVTFSRESPIGTTSLNLGFYPVSLRRQPGGTNPRVWAAAAVGAVAAGLALRRFQRSRERRSRR